MCPTNSCWSEACEVIRTWGSESWMSADKATDFNIQSAFMFVIITVFCHCLLHWPFWFLSGSKLWKELLLFLVSITTTTTKKPPNKCCLFSSGIPVKWESSACSPQLIYPFNAMNLHVLRALVNISQTECAHSSGSLEFSPQAPSSCTRLINFLHSTSMLMCFAFVTKIKLKIHQCFSSCWRVLTQPEGLSASCSALQWLGQGCKRW